VDINKSSFCLTILHNEFLLGLEVGDIDDPFLLLSLRGLLHKPSDR